jgi:MFS superfamily sulfate permease-like transporter
MFAVVRFADIEVAESLFWAWVLVGMLGLAAALVFGALAVMTVRTGARIRGVPARRVGLALLATLCILAALFLIGQTYAYLPAVALLLVVAVFAFYRLWRRAHP